MTSRTSLAPIAAIALGALVWLMPAVSAEVLEQVLVKVNGEIFTKTDLEARQVAALRQSGQDVDLKTAAGNEQLRKMVEEITPELMVNVIDEMLIVQRGRELGHRLSDDQFKSVVETLKKENNISSEEQFQAALKQENMTMDDLRRNLERQMIVQRVRQNEILGRVTVADDEARDYYRAHPSEFTSQPTVTLREIFVQAAGDGTPSAAALADARREAEDLRRRALAGESFEKLASDFSDAPSRANSGLIGPFTFSELSAEFAKRVKGMKQGEITEPIPTGRGFQLVKLESLSQAQTKTFDEAREDIANKIFAEKQRIEFDKYLTTLRAEAIIEWKNPEIRKAYEAGLAALKSAAAAAAPQGGQP